MRFSSRTPSILRVNALSLARQKRGAPRFDLTTTNPTDSGLSPGRAELSRAFSSGDFASYAPEPGGLRSAREAVCKIYAQKGYVLDPGQVFLTSSTSEAYGFLFKLLCNPGDRVLLPEPSYPLFEHLTELESVGRVPYRLRPETGATGWEIDLGSVERGLDGGARAMILVHPNNPTGSYIRNREMSAIVSMLDASSHALIRDEVFYDFPIDDCAEKAGVAGGGSEEVLTFSLGGLSKSCGLPQMKLAWVIISGPEELRREALPRYELIADTYLSVGTPVQIALPRLLEIGEKAAERIRTRIRENHACLRREFPPDSLGEGIRLSPVEAGWSAPLVLPSGREEETTVVSLLEEMDVFVQPGWFFGFSGEPRIVVSLLAEPEIFAEGIRRVSAFVRSGLPR